MNLLVPASQETSRRGFGGAVGMAPALPEPADALDPWDEVARFRTSTHFETLYRDAVERAAIDLPPSPAVLVLRSGGGETAVSPCLRLFRGAQLVATDMSAEHQGFLRRHLRESGAADRSVILQMAPERLEFEVGAFDLVTGVSVLNRLVDPDAALAEAARVLRPGGYAVFIEPFEGFGLMRLACEQLCNRDDIQTERLEPRVRSALEVCAADIAVRTRPNPSDPTFKDLDQKWLFSRENIAKAAEMLGFRHAQFLTHYDHERLYRDMLSLLLQQALGGTDVQMPAWAWALLDQFDAALTPSVKRLLLMEATIVLTR